MKTKSKEAIKLQICIMNEITHLLEAVRKSDMDRVIFHTNNYTMMLDRLTSLTKD
jgi:hypothetical protein